jgi:hypothetical protein
VSYYKTDDGLHEGRDAAEFPDGRFSVGSESDGAAVQFIGADLDIDAGRGVLDGRTSIGWRGVCTCGWRGPLWKRGANTPAHDPIGRKAFDPAPNKWAVTPTPVDEWIHREWLGHLPPQSLADVREAAEDVRKAQIRLDEAVRRARADGCSWADVGDGAGMTRQSAHERWGGRS